MIDYFLCLFHNMTTKSPKNQSKYNVKSEPSTKPKQDNKNQSNTKPKQNNVKSEPSVKPKQDEEPKYEVDDEEYYYEEDDYEEEIESFDETVKRQGYYSKDNPYGVWVPDYASK